MNNITAIKTAVEFLSSFNSDVKNTCAADKIMLLIISICVAVVIGCLLLTFSLFKSSMPKNLNELKFEIRYIWHGTVSNFEDMSLGLCYNRVCMLNKIQTFVFFLLQM